MKTLNHTFTGATAVRLSVCAAIAAVALSSCTQEEPPPPAEKEPDPVAVTGLSLDMASLDVIIAKGNSTFLRAIVLPEDATDKSVSWASLDENVATVDGETGEMTAVDYGRTKIIASASGMKDTCQVEVVIAKNEPGSSYWALSADGTLHVSGYQTPYHRTNTTSWPYWMGYSKAIKTVRLDESMNTISQYAFYGCSNLTDINIPDSLRNVGEYAFYDCSALTHLPLSNGVTTIGKATFWGCTGLTDITIPASVTEIGLAAFFSCLNLKTVTCLATTPPRLESMNFHYLGDGGYSYDRVGDLKLYVPAGSVEAYRASRWGDYREGTDAYFGSLVFVSIEAIPE